MLGMRLRQARRAQGLSPTDVVERMHSLGEPITDTQLSAIEDDRRLPDTPVLVKLGEVLHLQVSDLIHSPQELLALPQDERERILELAAITAEQDYRDNGELTDFEAFGDDDLRDSTP